MANPTFFAPHLTLRNVLAGMEFYKAAFGAIELRRWSNPDGKTAPTWASGEFWGQMVFRAAISA